MPTGASPKRERRARSGESRTASRVSTRDPESACERGGQRSHRGARGADEGPRR
ncbi:hypothetical protein [Streptomyces hainanensis]|uniref:hypothetical protein n=1 Tax=Streptomyces hainanensis TaxID=402648 RepID=UPI00267F136B